MQRLETLNLESNRITVIENVDGLHSLKNINLAGNLIVQVRGIDGLVNLETVNLQHNQISVVVSLCQLLSLKTLLLDHNKISRVAELAALVEAPHLKEIGLEGNSVVVSLDLPVFLQKLSASKVSGLPSTVKDMFTRKTSHRSMKAKKDKISTIESWREALPKSEIQIKWKSYGFVFAQ